MDKNPTAKEIEMVEWLMKPKGVEGFWRDVDIFMKYLYETYPQDMKELELIAQVERETAFNKFSASKSKSMRKLGHFPDRLIMMLDKIYGGNYPVEMERFKRSFFKRYPKLRIAEVI